MRLRDAQEGYDERFSVDPRGDQCLARPADPPEDLDPSSSASICGDVFAYCSPPAEPVVLVVAKNPQEASA
jgi:hypothetical protein